MRRTQNSELKFITAKLLINRYPDLTPIKLWKLNLKLISLKEKID